MKRRLIFFLILMMIAVMSLCACSSGKEGTSKALTAVLLIVLFIGTSLITAFLTYRSKTGTGKDHDDKQTDISHNKKE